MMWGMAVCSEQFSSVALCVQLTHPKKDYLFVLLIPCMDEYWGNWSKFYFPLMKLCSALWFHYKKIRYVTCVFVCMCVTVSRCSAWSVHLCMLLFISEILWNQPFPYIYLFQDTFIFKSGIDLYLFCKRREVGLFVFFSTNRAQASYTAVACLMCTLGVNSLKWQSNRDFAALYTDAV
jgi:hypothetical protein